MVACTVQLGVELLQDEAQLHGKVLVGHGDLGRNDCSTWSAGTATSSDDAPASMPISLAASCTACFDSKLYSAPWMYVRIWTAGEAADTKLVPRHLRVVVLEEVEQHA